MNQISNKGKQSKNPIIPKSVNKTFQTNTRKAEMNKTNPIILNHIPTVATVFFCSSWVLISSVILKKSNKIKFQLTNFIVIIREKSSKNSDIQNFVLFLKGVLI